MASAGSHISQLTDGEVVGVGQFQPIVLHTEHHDKGIGEAIFFSMGYLDSIFGSVIRIGIHRSATIPATHRKGIEIEVKTGIEIVEGALMLPNKVRANRDIKIN